MFTDIKHKPAQGGFLRRFVFLIFLFYRLYAYKEHKSPYNKQLFILFSFRERCDVPVHRFQYNRLFPVNHHL